MPTQDGYASPKNPTVTSAAPQEGAVVIPHKHTARADHPSKARVVVQAITPHGVHAAAKPARRTAH